MKKENLRQKHEGQNKQDSQVLTSNNRFGGLDTKTLDFCELNNCTSKFLNKSSYR